MVSCTIKLQATTVIEIGSSFYRTNKNQKLPASASVSYGKTVTAGIKTAGNTFIETVLEDFISDPQYKHYYKLGMNYHIGFEELIRKFYEDVIDTTYPQHKNFVVCLPSTCHSTHSSVVKKIFENMKVNNILILPKPVAIFPETGLSDVRVTLVNCGDYKELSISSSKVFTDCGMGAIDNDFEKKLNELVPKQKQQALISWNCMKESYPSYKELKIGKKDFTLEEAGEVWKKHLETVSNIVVVEFFQQQINNLKVFFIGGFSKFKPLQEKMKSVMPDNVVFMDDEAVYNGSLNFAELGYYFNYNKFPEVRHVKYDKEKIEIQTEITQTNKVDVELTSQKETTALDSCTLNQNS
ncbi:hypothetical protein ABK040_012071 [Willaertia magna]